MKKIVLFIAFFIILTISLECVYGDTPTDYISYWKFDENISDMTPDETGVNNGTLNGAIIVNDVERGNVASFDGIDDYIYIGDVFYSNVLN